MLPSKYFGKTVESIRKIEKKDFANLMPRPGWKIGLLAFIVDL
jgi:hypothetical protein